LTEPTLVAAPSNMASLRDTVFTRRNFLGLAAGSAAALVFYAGEIARHELEIIYLTIKLPRLPEAFAGMKIVQISDFHFQEYTEAAFLDAIVRKVNAEAADLVVLTGDFVSTKPLPRHFSIKLGYHCAEHLSRLTCPLRYAILGNHDCLVGTHAITDALHTHGIPVLANSFVPLERGGQRVWLAGIKDVLEDKPDLVAALPGGSSEQEPVILLAHEPDFADYAVGRRVDLILAGHTDSSPLAASTASSGYGDQVRARAVQAGRWDAALCQSGHRGSHSAVSLSLPTRNHGHHSRPGLKYDGT
jgi:hypothetical protein